MSQDSCDDEIPSKPPIDGNEDAGTRENHQEIATHQECERTPVNPTVTQPSSQNDQWQEEQKGYWERQIRLGKWLNWVTGVGIIVALGALYFVYLQAESARIAAKAAKVSADTLLASSRPWVTVKVEIAGGWKDGSNIKAKHTMRNIGPSPAIEVRITPSAMPHHFGDASFGDENLAAKQRELCSQGKRGGFGFGAPVLFPQEDWHEEIEVGLDKTPIKDAPATDDLQPGFPYLLGCVTYRFAFGDKSVHQTPYIYAMSRMKPKYVANSSSVTLDFGPASSTEIFLNQVILKGAPIPD